MIENTSENFEFVLNEKVALTESKFKTVATNFIFLELPWHLSQMMTIVSCHITYSRMAEVVQWQAY